MKVVSVETQRKKDETDMLFLETDFILELL